MVLRCSKISCLAAPNPFMPVILFLLSTISMLAFAPLQSSRCKLHQNAFTCDGCRSSYLRAMLCDTPLFMRTLCTGVFCASSKSSTSIRPNQANLEVTLSLNCIHG